MQLYGTSKESRDLRKHPSEGLSLKRPVLAQLVEEVFSSLVGMHEPSQNPSNDTQSKPLTMTLEGSLSHTAFPLSGRLHVDYKKVPDGVRIQVPGRVWRTWSPRAL